MCSEKSLKFTPEHPLLDRLKELKPALKEKYGIEEFALFGSFARGEQQEHSDVDIVILKIKEKKANIRLNAINFLKEKLKRDVDMGYFQSMKTFIKDEIKKDLIYV